MYSKEHIGSSLSESNNYAKLSPSIIHGLYTGNHEILLVQLKVTHSSSFATEVVQETVGGLVVQRTRNQKM